MFNFLKSKSIIILVLGLVLVSAPIMKNSSKFRDISFTEKSFPSFEPLNNFLAEVKEDTLISETVVPINSKVSIEPPETLPIITLTKKNAVTFRGVVTGDSVNDIQQKLIKLSNELPKNANIYLILDTPGGSVDAGYLLIDTIKGLPQRVHTITIFAASMGFHFVQNLNNRYILSNGTLMSHRVRISGLSGEVPGEGVVRMNSILKGTIKMDTIVANRIHMKLKDYQSLIADEYWVSGGEAVNYKMVDREVLIRCSEYLANTEETLKMSTLFGNIDIIYSKCPLLRAPIAVSLSKRSKLTAHQNLELHKFYSILISDKKRFVKEYITTDKLYNIVPRN
jgi:ATP-dependent Clp protease protease subunit